MDFNNIVSVSVPSCFQPHTYDAPATGQLLDHLRNGEKYVYFNVNPALRSTSNASPSPVVNRNPVLGEDNIYFPKDGSQPTTEDAARYSCANVVDSGPGSPGRNITKWYISAFGGSIGLRLAYEGKIANFRSSPEIGFSDSGGTTHIVKVMTGTSGEPADFPKQFWKAFRDIASNPVGRVLLYRILIEIRRGGVGGCCGDVLAPVPSILGSRNACRSITVKYTDAGCAFDSEDRSLLFDPRDTKSITVRIKQDGKNRVLDTDLDPQADSCDISIVHEMIHWFHYLRHPNRYNRSDSDDPQVYRYLLRCYYGDLYGISELYTWAESIDDEEFRTILGTPNYNDKAQLSLLNKVETFFPKKIGVCLKVNDRYIPEEDRYLEGDDLSENAYRISKEIHGVTGVSRYKMRFGHGGSIGKLTVLKGSDLPRRFRLAHLVALACYKAIIGTNVDDWNLVSGGAAQ